MSDLIAHPLTGGGAYTADMYRKVVNASITPSDGTPFGALQGIRAGAATPLVETDGLKAIIHPHTGWICPWTGVGAYSYAILDDTEIDFESSSQNYKLALVLDDPSQGHGSTPQLTARIYPAATSDTTIPGIVIATITNGTANDTAPILLPQALLMARDKTQLDTITATEGQKAKTLDDDTEYLYRDGAWVSLTQTVEWTSNAGGWSVSAKSIGTRRYVSARRTFQESTAPFYTQIAVDFPFTAPFSQLITAYGAVGTVLVADGYAEFSGRRLSVGFHGYGNSVTVSAAGWIYTI